MKDHISIGLFEAVSLHVVGRHGSLPFHVAFGSAQALFQHVHPSRFEIAEALDAISMRTLYGSQFLRGIAPDGMPVAVTIHDRHGAHLSCGDVSKLLSLALPKVETPTPRFRDGPVQRTGRRGRRRVLRRMRTTAERRASLAVDFDPEDGIAIPMGRACRNFANLVSRYDDIRRGETRSWKKHRARQWKDRP